MRCKYFFVFAVVAFSLCFSLVAQENALSPWRFSVSAQFSYYPDSASIPNTGNTVFAPVTAPFNSIRFYVTGTASYTQKIPFSDSMLFRDNTVTYTGDIDVTAMAISTRISVTFKPIAFFQLNSGVSFGSGWSLLGMDGLGTYNPDTKKYDILPPLSAWYFYFWTGGTLMFDTAVVWPGDWHHIVMTANFGVEYSDLLGNPGKTPFWLWRTGKRNISGWQFSGSANIGYQMPFLISYVGLNVGFARFFDDSVLGDYKDYDALFVRFAVSPVVRVSITKKDVIQVSAHISSRRAFENKIYAERTREESKSVGREFYFSRISIGYTHRF